MMEDDSFRADLHCHTHFSDGSFSPVELIEEAKRVGLSALSITDHDTVAAYPKAYEAAKKHQIFLGTGIEFSAVHENFSVHVLAYGFDLGAPALSTFCERHLQRRRKRVIEILQKLKQRGCLITLEEVEASAFPSQLLGRPHVAQEMVRKGYVSSIEQAFSAYLRQGAPCYVLGDPISLKETIELIHAIGGKAFLAHPHFIAHQRRLSKILTFPFDGIECYYAKMPLVQNQTFLQLAREKGLLISGGSDFHGRMKPQQALGSSFVDRAHFKAIFGDLLP